MCQLTKSSKPEITFKRPRVMWKIHPPKRWWRGPYYDTAVGKDGWSIPVMPEAVGPWVPFSWGRSYQGYHVFVSREEAERFQKDMGLTAKPRKVWVKGGAIATYRVKYLGYVTREQVTHIGYVVEKWKPKEK